MNIFCRLGLHSWINDRLEEREALCHSFDGTMFKSIWTVLMVTCKRCGIHRELKP